MNYTLITSQEVAEQLAGRLKKLRLSRKWKRTSLANRSGVSVASIIRFEQRAKISFENFLKLVHALGRLDEVEKLLQPAPAQSIEELERQDTSKIPKRGTI
jgi:HTH-type transcriptional regulator / antitoxin HipB